MKQMTYIVHHSSARKAVERVFGVLFKQFGIMRYSCRLADINDVESVALCRFILHNIFAQIRWYKRTIKFCRELEKRFEVTRGIEFEFEVDTDEYRYTQAQLRRTTINESEDTEQKK